MIKRIKAYFEYRKIHRRLVDAMQDAAVNNNPEKCKECDYADVDVHVWSSEMKVYCTNEECILPKIEEISRYLKADSDFLELVEAYIDADPETKLKVRDMIFEKNKNTGD